MAKGFVSSRLLGTPFESLVGTATGYVDDRQRIAYFAGMFGYIPTRELPGKIHVGA
jgi:hypothetical protein